jgi:hypothetical protein
MEDDEPHPYTAEGAIAGLGRFADGLSRSRRYRSSGSSGARRREMRSKFGRAIAILVFGMMLGGLISGLVLGLR